MNTEKQIEEMAKDLCRLPNTCEECPVGDMAKNKCAARKYAERAYDAGYRKASEVAEEIFAEIEEKVKRSIVIYLEEMNKEHIIDTPLYDRCSGSVFAFENMADFIAELKKKYAEGEK